ncbi:hypothetical protein ACFL6C_03040 [Myxococcota bacterium]
MSESVGSICKAASTHIRVTCSGSSFFRDHDSKPRPQGDVLRHFGGGSAQPLAVDSLDRAGELEKSWYLCRRVVTDGSLFDAMCAATLTMTEAILDVPEGDRWPDNVHLEPQWVSALSAVPHERLRQHLLAFCVTQETSRWLGKHRSEELLWLGAIPLRGGDLVAPSRAQPPAMAASFAGCSLLDLSRVVKRKWPAGSNSDQNNRKGKVGR